MAADGDYRASNGTFRSLRGHNYRTWASGAIVSNVGTWMQRTAQDWLVLTELTRHHATSVGVVMALQFGPQLLLLPWTGFAADHFRLRRLLFATQSAMGALALGLGVLTVTGLVRLWHVFGFALLLGCVAAFDAQARQAFVSELVDEGDLQNAVALNSASFNAARTIGPAIAGVLIALVGSGWVFVLNALSFVAVLASLARLHKNDLRPRARPLPGKRKLAEGFHYLRSRADLTAIFAMFFLIGTFGLNFSIFISTMAVRVFERGSGGYGLLSSSMAVGSVLGSLLAARQSRPSLRRLIGSSALFGLALAVAAVMPDYRLFALTLVTIGIAAQMFTASANGAVQLSTEPSMRGRVMAILFATALGGAPLGAPLVGYIADAYGPRASLGVGIVAGIGAALVGLVFLLRNGELPLRYDR